MWGEPDPDPGEGAPEPESSKESTEAKEQTDQQQLLLVQLKDVLKKEQSTVPQEKVEEYINTLTKAKAKKSRLKKDETGSIERSSGSVDSRKHEKLNLMKQQLEENKAKLAQRGMRQKDIEDMVTVLKAQLNDSSQQLINTTTVSLEKNVDYNKNTSPDELYNILLVKEKRIADLLEKVHKQEGNILDLQENLKEKDSVIDARTKAITLMTENLSKKGKDTLDTLDETKEQMRRMQENFILLESQMKDRQMILLNDLKTKNIEISDLQEQNESLIREIERFKSMDLSIKPESENHELVIKDLKSKLDASKAVVEENKLTIEESTNKINELTAKLESANGDNHQKEVEKLKKLLEESNKNMIKIKAQNKSKVKDLNKKLDGFKKMSDSNAMIIQLQNEITKLNEKIAELEEEKGNMQLKMVESIESIKGSSHSEDLKELEDKLDRNKEELEEKDKIINLLESDILSMKNEIATLNEKVSGFSQLKTDQVSSEMQSIQIEEQLELLQTANKELQSEIESLRKEKEELCLKIEEFSKEKAELASKLDNYVQENMELIDKLEKLSAEKVSSAESIEIVEGLTQQEKLELAAYQKSMDDPSKNQEEEQQGELNESVLQLTEETAELLKKIEMFTMERKEVMAKLDSLRDENTRLSLKINEIENNRDILAETYEQVQTEKDELVKENENLLNKLKEFENIDCSELDRLRNRYEEILEENEQHKKLIKEFDSKIHEKDNLESELVESKQKLHELESKLTQHIEEINNYQSIIEDNKTEFINSSGLINKLQAQLSERENEVRELNELLEDLNRVVSDLQQANAKLNDFESLEKQVDELKTNLEEIELAKTQELDQKNREIGELSREIQQLRNRDGVVSANIEEMKQKYLTLQAQLDNNNDSLHKQVQELTNKNKEQLEKMKKIAANLKKKTQAYQDLEQKYNEEKEKWETEANTKESNRFEQLTREIDSLKSELLSKSSILEQSEGKIKDLQNIISALETQNIELSEFTRRQEKVTEVSLKQELSTSLHEEFENSHGSKESIHEDKINELQLIIETHEAELQHYKERSQMLEEDLSILVEEKERLVIKCTKLEEKSVELAKIEEEKRLLEEEMDLKLQEYGNLVKRVDELGKENGDLAAKIKEQEDLIAKLKIKVKKAQEKLAQNKSLQSELENQEQLINDLRKQLAQSESAQKQIQQEYEESQRHNRIDYERIEIDYQSQLDSLSKSKNELTFECEKLQEEVKQSKERECELAQEINENNQKIAELSENLHQKTAECHDALQQIESLQNELENTKKSTNLFAVPEESISEKTTNLFAFPEDSTGDFFSTIDQPIMPIDLPYSNEKNTQTETHQEVNVTKEDLESKIKALEILLYNVDQEKEQVILECSEMLNELTRLVYEKINVSNLSGQIVSQEEIDSLSDSKRLQKIEFEPVQPDSGPQEVPVEEHIPPPSTAYLTYPELEQTRPVERTALYQVGENDDGWGWGPEEARLEEEHQYKTENNPQVLALRAEIESLKTERDRFEQETKQLQLKSSKLIKKCKELKTKNDQLSSKSIDLDETIQEELKTRVEQLESKLKELTSELDKEKQDKSNLLKKIEALNASSSKILENKEIQEAEIYRWKRMYEEVRDQLDHLDWGNDESKSPKRRIQPSEGGADDLEELKKLVHDLTVDNEELQALLNDQKQQRVQLERSKSVNNDERVRNLEEDVASKNGAVEELKKNVEVLQEQLQEAFKELEGKNSIIRDLEGALEELKLSVDNKEIDGEVEALREQLKQSFNELNAKNTTINTLEEALDRFKTALESKENDSKQEKFDRDLLQEQLKQSLNEIEAKNTSIDDLQRALEESKSKENDPQLQQLENLLSQKTAIAEQFQLSNDSLSTEISRLRDELDMAKILQADASKIIENLQKQLERESEINQSIQQITNFKANNIEELMQLFNDEKLRSKGLEEDLEEQKLINDQLRIENTNKLGGNEHLEGDLNKLKEELNEINRAIQQLTEFKANNVEELIRLFNDEKLRSKGLEEDLEEQKLINDQLRIENTNKLGGNEQLEGDLKKLKEELNEINRAIQQLTEFKANNVEELIRLFNDEKMRSKGLEDDLEEQKLINDQLRIENTNKLGGNEHSEDDMKWLKTELNEMNQAIQQLTNFKANDIREFMELFHSETTRFKASEDLLQNEIRSLKDELSSKQLELDDLEEKWSQRVDERGNAVAESWKYHLSIVESDFAALQAKLKGEIDELEEKCNALVNENNELRKNVDAEIKNEVDRISALQQQINDRQRAVNDLKQMLAGEQAEKAALAQRVSDLDGIQQVLADKEVELASLRTLAETTRQQFDEKRELVEEIVRILESNTSYPLSCETRDILDELQRQLMVNKRDADKLNADLSDLKAKLQQEAQANREKDEQINDWKQYAVILKDNETEMGKLNADLGDLNAKLQQEALASREKDEQIGNLRSQLQQYAVILKENETEIGKLNTQLQNYSIIIHENQSKLDENEKLLQQNEEFKQQLTNLTGNREEMSKLHADLLEKDFELSAVYREKEQQLQEYNTILKQHETEIEKLNAQLQNYNTFVQENQIKIDTLEQNLANNGHKMQELLNKLGDNNKEMELSQIREAHSMLQQSLSESQQQLFQLNQDLSAKTHQYDAISEQLSYSQQNGDLLQREIDQLHHALRQKDQDLENLRNTCYKELESHYEEAITGKDLEVQTLRAQMEEVQAQFSEAQAKLVEQTALMDEEEKQLNETRSIIAEQVLVIEELKQKLFEKSNDYDSLIAEMDISRKAITQQPTASTSVDSTDARRVEDDLSEPVNRAELDLALYMLHQRDVRCEELTMELTHLLEERDTLQLKLSNAIREREQLLRSMKTSPGDGGVEASGSMPDTPKTSKSSEIFLAASGIELASEPTEQMVVQQDLANKLSELKSVGYRRDKTFVDEQEQRRMQQISIMQQHIKEASRLPPEAAAKLVDASYTLSRDVQSPSKVLLNWLWGRSTPKSNDT